MRKPVSCALVGLMLLSIFGFYGGVVEEAEGSAIYDSGSNTIYLTGYNQLFSIYSVLSFSDPGIFNYYSVTGTYTTNASIQIESSGTLDITYSSSEQALKFDYNSSGLLKLIVIGNLSVSRSEPGYFRFDSNQTSPGKGDWEGLIFQDAGSSESELSYTEVFNASIGITCDNSDPTIINSNIAYNQQYGIYIQNSIPNIVRNKIYNNGDSFGDSGVYSQDSKFIIENCTLNNAPYNDLIILGVSDIITLNTTFDETEVDLLPPSQITVKWLVDILVRDNESGDPIPGASIIIENKTSVPIEGSPFITDDSGNVMWVKVTEYIDNATTGTIEHTPHNITAMHDEYYSNFSVQTIDSSKPIPIKLDMIRRDLTTTPNDITFQPSGIPVAGENLTVYVEIHNVEVDDAQNVRVKIFDNTTADSVELYHIIIPEIKGNSFYEISKRWKPIPGTHIIEVYIDPDGEIKEINSTMGGDWAENNNNVTTTINVNARPMVNVTQPGEKVQVNGTITIEGNAIDDPRDDEWDLTNNITRVDIQLKGFDWIQLYPPNVVPNFLFGNWTWFYDWDDTTQWNGTDISDGNYTLQARAWDGYHYSYLYEVNITVNNTGANEPPVAIINEPLNHSDFSINETIRFNGSLSYDPNDDALTYEWEFGDGNVGSGNVTYHFYTQKGTYQVNLTVNDTQVQNNTYIVIYINNTAPNAKVTASTDTAYINETITFYGYNSTDEETPESLIYYWDYDASVDSNGDLNYTNDMDNVTSSPNSTHSYTDPDSYTVTLTVGDGQINSTDTVTVTIEPNAAPIANISNPLFFDSFSVNETIFFNASGSSDPNDLDLLYKWQFGDGSETGWQTTPTYNYSYSQKASILSGYQYIVNLTVSDGDEESIDTVTIMVGNHMPVAISKANLTETLTFFEITFWGNESYDPDEDNTPPEPSNFIVNYTWDFGDGEIYTETSGSAPDGNFDGITTHQYFDASIYIVNLTVTDNALTNNPASNSTSIYITILNREPVFENITISPSEPKMDEEITFTVTALDDDGIIVEYEWNFGDGVTYTESTTSAPDGTFDGKTTHSYSSKDSYLVWITITDDDGAQNSTQFWVDIANTAPDAEIKLPNENDQVSGVVSIEGTSDDADGSVSEVEVKIDDGVWQPASGTDPWSFSWDTSSYYNGQHTIYARAYDSEDYTSPPASITVNVTNTKSSITLTENLDPTSVEQGGTVNVYGNALYNTGEPVVNADVNISILNEDVYWVAKTDANGVYSQDITAPSDAGSYWIKASVTKSGFSDSQQERLTVQVPPSQPDLQISSSNIIFNKNDPYSGEIVQITVGVNNIGTEEALDVVINAYYGDPASGGRPTSPDSTKTISQIPGGETGFITFNWDTSDITGSQDVYMVVDPGNSISESNEDNNKDYKTIIISGRADFEIDSDDITFSNKNPVVDDTITIFIVIHNIGTERKGVKYEVFDGDPDDTEISIDSGEETLSGDTEKRILITWTPDEAGEHLIYVVLTPKTGVEESDESNNEAFVSLTVEEKSGENGPPSNLLPMIVVLVVIVLLILFILYKRGQGEKPLKQDIPTASVVQKTSVAKVIEPKEKKEEEPVMDGQGGMRI